MADEFRLNVTERGPSDLDARFRKKVNDIFNKGALDAVDELQRNSPVGASRELKQGWDIIPARRSSIGFEVSVPIINRAPNALNRIAGRGPGKFPPTAPVEAWVKAVIRPEANKVKGIAFLIRRKIAKEGTKRWRSQENFAGIDRQGRPLPGSPIKKAEERIAAELQQLSLQ